MFDWYFYNGHKDSIMPHSFHVDEQIQKCMHPCIKQDPISRKNLMLKKVILKELFKVNCLGIPAEIPRTSQESVSVNTPFTWNTR